MSACSSVSRCGMYGAAHVLVGPSKTEPRSDAGNLPEADFKAASMTLCLVLLRLVYYPNPAHRYTASLTGQITMGNPVPEAKIRGQPWSILGILHGFSEVLAF